MNYEFAILIAIAAVVYSTILTEEDSILHKWYLFLYDLFDTDQRAEQGKSKHWLFMLLIYCEKCIAGQMAFWLYICTHNIREYIWYNHIFFTAATIFAAAIVKWIYKQTQS